MERDPILLVEDNPDDAAFTRLAFKKTSFTNELVVAEDGARALSRLLPEDNASALRPALVLLDINMPKVGGFEVLRNLRSHPSTQLLPVIMLTTSNLRQDILESYRLGANSYICKPVSLDDFQDTITTLASYWLRINEGPADARAAEPGYAGR